MASPNVQVGDANNTGNISSGSCGEIQNGRGDSVALDSDSVNHNYDLVDRLPAKNSLIWIKACLGGQELPAMIDSGANPNCLSLRCVQGSEWLRKVQRHQYSGKGIVDANGEPIQPSFVIKCCLTVGSPKIVVNTEFVVIQSLPFSCIIGQHTLRRFSSWEVSNTNKILMVWVPMGGW